MKYWILGIHGDDIYVLDESYNVWDFDAATVKLINQYTPISGVLPGGLVVAVRTYSGLKWDKYIHFGIDELNTFRSQMLARWDTNGFLYSNSLQIYSPNLVLSRGIKGLLSESGDLLRADIERDTVLELALVSHRILGFLYGSNFNVVLTEDIDIVNYHFLQYAHNVKVIFDFHGHDNVYNYVHRMLFSATKSLVTVRLGGRRS